ncbi:MAG: DUF2202 domain-containing protein [Erysipelotrichaceae bacterium]|nr:DUF2202 domain-containing protein [Erysipelotrichaceae bacterium]
MNKTLVKGLISLSVGGMLIGSTFMSVDAKYGNQSSNQVRQNTIQVEAVSAEVLEDLETMFTVLINDEYKARAEYQAIVDEFGAQAPFTNLIKAETMHINALTRLFNAYGLDVPSDEGSKSAVVPDTLEEVYAIGVDAEVDNIALYEKYLDQDLPTSVERVFTNLQKASENHLATFEAYEDGKTPVDCDPLTDPLNRNMSSRQNKQFGRNQ